MKLSKIHHVAIIVSDYKKSREFYVEKLGFRVIRENYRPEREDYKLDLELDGCELEIFSGKGNPPRVNYPEACGLRHLAFYVEDMEKEELRFYFPEFSPYEGTCRFLPCTHTHEPGCSVKEALENGKISKERYKNYVDMYRELEEKRRY